MRNFLLIGLSALVGLVSSAECPEALQITCVDDVRAAYDPCKKAAESGGSDTAADINCLKYYSKMRTDCWPCICMIAQMEHVQIKGC